MVKTFAVYKYRVWQAPAWYQEQWIQHKRDTENVSEVKKVIRLSDTVNAA